MIVISLAWLLVSASEAYSRWKSEDPKCSGAFAPSQSDDPEAWFEWWSGCITDEPETNAPEEPPETCKNNHTFTDPAGRCWRLICLSNFEWRLEPCIKSVSVLPHIQSLTVRTDGYLVNVATRQGITRRSVRPSQIALIGLARAMVRGSQLPSEDIHEISQDFWTKQTKTILKPKIILGVDPSRKKFT